MNKVFICLILCLFFCSCASIMHGDYQVLEIENLPDSGYMVKHNGVDQGQVTSVLVLRKSPGIVVIHQTGCKPQEIVLTKEINIGFLVLDLVCGGVIAVLIDLVIGSLYDVDPAIIEYIKDCP